MTPPKKPDWMEIADNDSGSDRPTPVAKSRRPFFIVATALAITFGGAVIAQSSQDSPTSVEQSIVPQASQSATSVAPAISPTGPSATNPPAIASPPSMKGGDDDDDDFEEDGHRDRRDREHGERDGDRDDDHDDDEFEDH
jgi:hypothetical protein